MKNSFFLFLIFFSLIGCKNNDKDYLNVINKNNANLKIEIEEFKYRMDICHSDMPGRFNDSLVNSITKLSNDILNFKDVSKYTPLITQLDKTAKFHKININLKGIESDNQSILINNLLLNLNNFAKLFVVKKFNYSATHCFFGDLIKYERNTIADSIIVDFKVNNQFHIIIDSIIENKKKIKYHNVYKSNIGQLKFKNTNSQSLIFGKIFQVIENGEPILIQTIQIK